MQIYRVGGAVRDRLLGRPVSEVDWVVVGACAETLQAQGFRPVGRDFPVFLHPETGEEYALARTERKTGRGYGGFTFYAAPDVTLEQDLQRRDLTINAMAEDAQGRLIDPCHGQADLQARLLRHISPAFAEDPLRVLRVARFAARYHHLGFRIAPETLALMQQISHSGELEALTPERCWKEISRALMEPSPEIFIRVLQECAALERLLPALARLFHQQPEAGTGCLEVLRNCASSQQPLAVRWACLLLGLASPEAIRQSSQHYRVPRDCQELAWLASQHHLRAGQARQLTAATLLELLQQLDAWRRPERFSQFLAVCRLAQPGQQADLQHLAEAARLTGQIESRTLLAQGYHGAGLGQALSRQRLRVLEQLQQMAQSSGYARSG